MNKKKVFFVTYGGGHANIIDLVVEELLKNTNIEFKILALTTAHNNLINKYSDAIVKSVLDYSFLFEDIQNEVHKYGTLLLKDNYNEESKISKEETIIYLGLSFFCLVDDHGYDKAIKLYNKKKRQAFLPTKVLEKILKYEKSDVVVATTSPRFEYAAILAGNILNIQTIQILDLFGQLYPLPAAKHLVVMNESVKKVLVNQGLVSNKYHILGQPVIENTVSSVKKVDIQKAIKKLNINNENRFLFLATQRLISVNKEYEVLKFMNYELTYNVLFPILEKLSNIYNLNIIIRLHPNENIKDYVKYFNRFKFLKYTNDILSLEECIAISDIVLVESSTVALEAVACNKKVFTYKQNNEVYYAVPAFKKLPFVFSSNLKELEKNLFGFLNDNDDFCKSTKFMPSNSVKNIIKLINKV